MTVQFTGLRSGQPRVEYSAAWWQVVFSPKGVWNAGRVSAVSIAEITGAVVTVLIMIVLVPVIPVLGLLSQLCHTAYGKLTGRLEFGVRSKQAPHETRVTCGDQ